MADKEDINYYVDVILVFIGFITYELRFEGLLDFVNLVVGFAIIFYFSRFLVYVRELNYYLELFISAMFILIYYALVYTYGFYSHFFFLEVLTLIILIVILVIFSPREQS